MKRLLVILLICGVHLSAYAQEGISPGYWLSLGAGYGLSQAGYLTENGHGLAVRAALNLQVERLVIRVRFSTGVGDTVDTRGVRTAPDNLSRSYIYDFGIMAGIVLLKKKQWEVVAAVGYAKFDGSEPRFIGTPENGHVTNGSIEGSGTAIELGYYYTIGKSQNGLGLVAFGNLNSQRNFGGITLSWIFGRFD